MFEIRLFEEHRAEWLEHHKGKVALVKGETIEGFYGSAQDAYHRGVNLWGDVPFLIKDVLPEDPVCWT